MPIEFECPHCHTMMNVGDQFTGTTGPCRSCGQQITIPGQPLPAGGPPAKSSFALPIIAVLGGCAVIAIPVIGILVALLLPAVQAAREAARRSVCLNNQKQIGLALHNYESVHGELPPAFVADEDGKPMHSWRVLILPYLEESGIYAQYNMDEPWDSPANMAVTQQMPQVYQCPSDSGSATDTSYFVISDAASMFPRDQPRKFSDVSDGLSNTIAIVEATGMGVPWAKPIDLTMEDLDQIVSNHPGVVNVTYGDGHVKAASAVERSMVTVAGGD